MIQGVEPVGAYVIVTAPIVMIPILLQKMGLQCIQIGDIVVIANVNFN